MPRRASTGEDILEMIRAAQNGKDYNKERPNEPFHHPPTPEDLLRFQRNFVEGANEKTGMTDDQLLEWIKSGKRPNEEFEKDVQQRVNDKLDYTDSLNTKDEIGSASKLRRFLKSLDK
jgi:hypothetical protein